MTGSNLPRAWNSLYHSRFKEANMLADSGVPLRAPQDATLLVGNALGN